MTDAEGKMYIHSKHKCKCQFHRENINRGFSLVEVLVSIAVVAIICVPLFSGFRVSAVLNSKANSTQKVTAYAQQELELIKSTAVENYIIPFKDSKTADGVTYRYVNKDAGNDEQIYSEWNKINTEAAAQKNTFVNNYRGSLSEAEIDELFTPFICEKTNIKIGNKTYKMYVKFKPAEYSQWDETTAANVNVAGYYDVAEADAMRYAVISDEINLYDNSCVDLIQEKLKLLGEESKSDADILGNLTKTVTVEIVSPSSDAGTSKEKMSVSCDVTYTFQDSSTPVELIYNVYNGTYTVEPSSAEENTGEESGGRVFLLAKAFQYKKKDGTLAAAEVNQCKNVLIIKNTGNTDVYFVLGKDSAAENTYNFSTITLQNGQNEADSVDYIKDYYLNTAFSSSAPGQMDIPGGTDGKNGMFYCNIKGSGTVLNDSEYDTIGAENYKTISYAVEIDMYEEDKEDVRVAHLEATKIN
jgi:prepilin-type N-terminal cleavage/methylation domain-containing protein